MRWCESSLAIREALVWNEIENERDGSSATGLVVITPLAKDKARSSDAHGWLALQLGDRSEPSGEMYTELD